MVRLDACTSAGECLDLLAARAATLAPDEWLMAVAARVQAWEEGAWPPLAALNKASGGHPCVVMSFDLHSAMANTKALDLSGVLQSTPAGGVVCTDNRGQPSGVLLEAAAQRAFQSAPEPTREQWRGLLPFALQDLARHGFTEVHDLLAPAWLGPMLAAIDRRGELPLSVRLFVPYAELGRALAERSGWTTDRVSLAGAKLFADGTLNSRTAHVLTPCADPLPDHPHGTIITDTATLQRAIEETARLGMQLAVHAIGDAAVRSVLDAAEGALSALRSYVRHGRLGHERARAGHVRIEHCELIDEADVPRFAQLGVTASVQPCHLLADIEALRRYFPHRLQRVLPLRELIDAGLEPGRTLIFGSDVPVVRPDPEDSIHAAVYRRREGMGEGEAIAPAHAITEAEAWACFRPAYPLTS